MLKVLVYLAWALFAVELGFAVFAVTSEGYTDAAGRGLVRGFGLIALGLLAASGACLYFAARAHSWLGVIVVLVLLGVPALFVYGLDPPYFTRMILGLFRR